MNPITRLFIYIIFSISILLSKSGNILLINVIVVFFVFILKRSLLGQFWKSIKPYMIYLPLSGVLFFIISIQISTKSIPIIFIDVLLATTRLLAMISIMTFYIIQTNPKKY